MSQTVYEDNVCYVTVDDSAWTLGHLKVYPHKKVGSLHDIAASDVSHLFVVASSCATLLFEGLKAQGTNILCQNGYGDHVYLDVVARFSDDALGLIWEPQPADRNEIQEAASKIKDAIIPQDPPDMGTTDVVDDDNARLNDVETVVETDEKTEDESEKDPYAWDQPVDPDEEQLRRMP